MFWNSKSKGGERVLGFWTNQTFLVRNEKWGYSAFTNVFDDLLSALLN